MTDATDNPHVGGIQWEGSDATKPPLPGAELQEPRREIAADLLALLDQELTALRRERDQARRWVEQCNSVHSSVLAALAVVQARWPAGSPAGVVRRLVEENEELRRQLEPNTSTSVGEWPGQSTLYGGAAGPPTGQQMSETTEREGEQAAKLRAVEEAAAPLLARLEDMEKPGLAIPWRSRLLYELRALRAALADEPEQKPQEGGTTRRYRKKPVEVDAFQMTEERRWRSQDCPDWWNQAWNVPEGEPGSIGTATNGDLFIYTLEGKMRAAWGDWIIRGVAGEIYPCKPEIFAATYEKVEE